MADDSEIPRRLDDVRRRRRLRGELERQCEVPLRDLDADETLEALASQSLEALQQEIETLIAAEAAATEHQLQLEKDKTAAETELKALQARPGGFAARADQEAVLARLRRLLPEYVVAVLGQAVLETAVQSYRDRNASGLIDQAGVYFRTLTGGSFVGLDLDDTTLVCVRPDGVRSRTLSSARGEGLSEGSYDQLFALRLAFLHEQVAHSGPMPIILDDVLLTFDDRRATAALACFAELAAHTQVLLFTHHRHLAELAKASPAAERIAVMSI